MTTVGHCVNALQYNKGIGQSGPVIRLGMLKEIDVHFAQHCKMQRNGCR